MSLPSVAQMKNRMQWKHRHLLKLFDGVETVSAAFINRYPTERRTLLRWECVEMAGRDAERDLPLYRLTERGAALRSAMV